LSSTIFEQLHTLKDKYGNDYKDFDIVVNNELKHLLYNRTCIYFSELLLKLDGIFPKDLYELLKKNRQDKKIISTEDDFANLEKNEGWHKFIEQLRLPPPHLVNYEWRYTEKSASIISNLLVNNDKTICCLGTPTIFLDLYSKNVKATLFDINAPLIERVRLGLGTDCYVYDVQTPLPDRFSHSFDTICLNPPWYTDYYKLFIERALFLLKRSGGELIFPLFPLFSRHNACKDLSEIESYLSSLNYHSIESLGNIDFEMPEFEQIVLINNNIPIPKYNWRQTELIKVTFNNIDFITNKLSIIEEREWIRYYDDISKNYYAINKMKFKDFSFQVDESIILSEISKKHIKTISFDVWDNRNNITTLK